MGTDVALSKVTDLIESAIYREQYVLGIFFDIESAFDTVCNMHTQGRRFAIFSSGAQFSKVVVVGSLLSGIHI